MPITLEKPKIADSQQRQQALDPRESFIVQAPAGSGKTSLLTARYLNLLAQVDAPEEILAITFTRKAAGEMQERILQVLTSIQKGEALPSSISSIPKKAALHAQSLIENPQRMRIYTIDAFCAYLVKRMPIRSRFTRHGIHPQVSVLYQKAAEQTLEDLDKLKPWSPAIEALLIYLDNRQSHLTQLIAQMLSRREQWLPHIGTQALPGDLRKILQHALGHVVDHAINTLYRQIPSHLQGELIQLIHFASEQAQEEFSLLSKVGNTLPEPQHDKLPIWQSIASLLLNKQGQWRKTVTSKMGFPAPSQSKNPEEKAHYKLQKQRMVHLLETLQDYDNLRESFKNLQTTPSPIYPDIQWDALEALLQLLPIAAAKLQLVFDEHNAVDFTAISLAAEEALGGIDNPSQLALSLEYSIKHILMDEFQDTSMAQYRLLEKLTAGWQAHDGHSLFIVGDPMQSIYRFREAEVGLFLEVKSSGINGLPITPLTLSTNFRSQSQIIDWVNDTFHLSFPSYADSSEGAIPYSPATAMHRDNPNAAVTWHIHSADSDSAQGHDIVAIVQKTWHEQPQGRIALLVRSRAQLNGILPYLIAAQIPYQATEINALSHKTLIQDLLTLTRALCHLGDRVAWLALLRAPWCGLSLENLLSITEKRSQVTLWQSILNCIENPPQALSSSGLQRLKYIAPILQQAIEQRDLLHERVHKTWVCLNGPACAKDQDELLLAEQFFQLMAIHQQQNTMDMESFTQLLQGIYTDNIAYSEPYIEIMTIHKAKGLEFDTVILPFLERGTHMDEHQLMAWMELPNDELILAPIPNPGNKHPGIYDFIRREQNKRQFHEWGRLLYVAVTRAKSNLHLLATLDVDDNNDIKPPVKNSLLYQCYAAVKHEISQVYQEKTESPTQAPRQEKTPLYRLKDEYFKNSPILTKQLRPTDNNPFCEETQQALSIMGILMHRQLQEITQQGHFDNQFTQRLHGLWRHEFQQQGIRDCESFITLMHESLQNCLESSRFQWIIDKNHEHSHCELALNYQIADQYKTVIIDRTFVDGQGKCWIIDYKTTTTKVADTDFLEKQRNTHREQLEGYAKLLQNIRPEPIYLGLYFPMLDAWCEWPYGGA